MAEGGLAAAGLAHQSEGLAPADVEGQIGDRLDAPCLMAEDTPGHHRELLDHLPDLDDVVRRGQSLDPRRLVSPLFDGYLYRNGALIGAVVDRMEAGEAMDELILGHHVGQRWVFVAALVGGVLAAGCEPAVGDGLGEVGRQTGDGQQPLVLAVVQPGDRGQKGFGVGMADPFEELPRSPPPRRSCRHT